MNGEDQIRLIIAQRLKPVGGRVWMTKPDGEALAVHARADPAVAKALKAAHAKLSELGVGPMTSDARLMTAKGAGNPHLRMQLRLTFLAPDLQEAILEGRVYPSLAVAMGAVSLMATCLHLSAEEVVVG